LVGDVSGIVTKVNAAACGLTGYRPSELVGMNVLDLVAPEWGEFAVRQWRRDITTPHELTRYECTFLTKAGTRVPVRVTSTLVRERGEIAGLQAVVQDASKDSAAQSRLHESENRFRNTFDGAAIGMAMLSQDGRLLRVNGSLSQLLGYSQDELLDLTFHDITHPDDLERDLELLQDLVAGSVDWYHMEKRYVRKDGAVFWGLLAVTLVRGADGAPAYFVRQISDITAAKRAAAIRHDVLSSLPGGQGRLSPRETDVLRLLAAGQRTSEAASSLGVSGDTVQTLVKRAMRKLGARNRTHLVARAIQLGSLDPISSATDPPETVAARNQQFDQGTKVT
jgi:PAS domain S-box-containing protein